MTGSAAITSKATNSPTSISLSGTGLAPVVHTVALSWNASASSGIAGYYVYRSIAPGTTYTKLVASPLSGLTIKMGPSHQAGRINTSSQR